MATIQQQIQAFTCGKETEYTFPAGLGVEERKLVKASAEKLGLSSRSFGMGKDRQIHIFKPASWSAPAMEPSVNSETDSGSTVDSESERQDPTISIKNTFVHIVMDNADPRIIQSMPAGTFAANIEAEKMQEEAANAKTRSQKRRPLALSQISPRTECDEPESETVASAMFPSTPNAENFLNTGEFHNGMTEQGARHADAVPVVQWIPPAAAAPESVTILPPVRFTAHSASAPLPIAPAPLLSPVMSESSPVIRAVPPTPQGPAQGWTQELPQAVPQGAPQGQPHGNLHSPAQALPQGQPIQSQGSAYLVPGTPVVLQGLANQPDFNGLHGVVNTFDAECGRYNVMIEIGPNAHRRLVKVKSQNLQPAQSLAQVPPASAGQPPCCHLAQQPAQVAPGAAGQPPCCHPAQQPVAGHSSKASLVLSHMV
jgi:hypothetical protein